MESKNVMSKFKAVIFDLDGTLLDSIEDLADSMNAVLAKAGYPVHDLQSYKYFVGNGMKNLVINALPPEHRNEDTIKIYTQKMKEEYAKRWNVKTRPYEGIPELLDALETMGMDMAVLSNKPDNFTKIIVEELLPKWKFSVVFGERTSVPRKPDPTGALEIAHILNLKPHEVLYLGDTGTDMKTAVSAGMYAVGALWGFREKDELLENGAKVIIQNPLELLNIL